MKKLIIEIEGHTTDDLTLALEEIEKSISLYSNEPDGFYLQGKIQAEMNFLEAAESSYRTATQLNRRHCESWFELSNISKIKNDPLLVKHQLLRCVACNNVHIPAWQSLANLFQDLGEEEKAKSCLKEIEKITG